MRPFDELEEDNQKLEEQLRLSENDFTGLTLGFDDRATAAFEILGEVAENIQILYSSDLVRDVEAAENTVLLGGPFQHRIGAG
jgi:hypothetical protein